VQRIGRERVPHRVHESGYLGESGQIEVGALPNVIVQQDVRWLEVAMNNVSYLLQTRCN
jgi:hypothetical protein